MSTPQDIPISHIQEGVSTHFISLISRRAGLGCSNPGSDYGVDLKLRKISSRIDGEKVRVYDTGQIIDVQIKCAHETRIRRTTDSLTYALEAKTYNDLVERRTRPGGPSTPLFLFLVVIPDDHDEWVQVSADCLKARHSAFWYQPEPDAERTENRETKTITIRQSNVVSVESLHDLFTEHFQ